MDVLEAWSSHDPVAQEMDVLEAWSSHDPVAQEMELSPQLLYSVEAVIPQEFREFSPCSPMLRKLLIHTTTKKRHTMHPLTLCFGMPLLLSALTTSFSKTAKLLLLHI
jgi:hypothetical protein